MNKESKQFKLYKPNRNAIKRQERLMANNKRWNKEKEKMRRLQEKFLSEKQRG